MTMLFKAVLNWDYPKYDTLYSKSLGPEIVQHEKVWKKQAEGVFRCFQPPENKSKVYFPIKNLV